MNKVDNSAKSHKKSHSGPVIGLFAKQPLPGRVKTRLTPPLSAEQACRLYRVALQESFATLCRTGRSVVICYAGERRWFEETFPGQPLLAQQGALLGDRMNNAMLALFAAGAGPVLLAGSDSPDLPLGLVEEAVERLAQQDVVVVPCRDGGYAVVGLRQPAMGVFDDIPWSTPAVLEATRRRCRERGLGYHETSGWDDLDEIADLRRLVRRSPDSLTARHIAETLRELL